MWCDLSVDNSEWMRNGDYTPSRLGAQLDAANTVSNRRINPPSHPENTVGIMTIAGRTPEVMCTPTRDQSLLMTATEEVQIGDRAKVYHAIKVALLALKHRTVPVPGAVPDDFMFFNASTVRRGRLPEERNAPMYS